MSGDTCVKFLFIYEQINHPIMIACATLPIYFIMYSHVRNYGLTFNESASDMRSTNAARFATHLIEGMNLIEGTEAEDSSVSESHSMLMNNAGHFSKQELFGRISRN